ncbi:phosphotransferase [Cellulomonas sp. ICMP 17802]|uniref:phosphotransferase n=1 Tax=Cellulomonas sp. ICMP 17802 TaxID=3239199 RepID=UPI00351ABD31
MVRSPLALAALATVAVPGLDAFDVRRPAHPGSDFDTAVVIDAFRNRWVVRAPQHAAAGAALEAEVVLLGALAAEVERGKLPFAVPAPVGFAHLPEGGRAAVHPEIPGTSLRLEHLAPGPGLAAALGRAIAAVHELPTSLVENAGLPVYDAGQYRQRRQSEVDEAARTGKVPPALLRRWEERLEDVALWRFRPTVVHGDLTSDRVLVTGDAVSGVLHWGDACVADPADDLAWLLVAAAPDVTDSIMEAYQLRRTELTDPHLADRALLAGELALARWLLYGVRSHDDEIIADAVAMLEDLDAHTRQDTEAESLMA